MRICSKISCMSRKQRLKLKKENDERLRNFHQLSSQLHELTIGDKYQLSIEFQDVMKQTWQPVMINNNWVFDSIDINSFTND